MAKRTQIVKLGANEYGVYLVGPPFAAGPYGTPLLFRGDFDACQEFRHKFEDPNGGVVDPEFHANED